MVSASTWLSADTLFLQTFSLSPIGMRVMLPNGWISRPRCPVIGRAASTRAGLAPAWACFAARRADVECRVERGISGGVER
jgi:hypothetical protein